MSADCLIFHDYMPAVQAPVRQRAFCVREKSGSSVMIRGVSMAEEKSLKAARACSVILLCLIMLACVLCPVPADAADNMNKTVRVGYYENEVFQEGAHAGAVKTGYAYEYYQKLSEYTGWRYDYVYGEFGDLYQKLLDGKIDFLAGLAWQEERGDLIGYPDTPMGHETYSLLKHSNGGDITADPATLSGKRIGVLDSAMASALRGFLEKHGVLAEVVLYRDYAPLFTAFDKHDIDVLAAEGDGAYGRSGAELLCSFGAVDYYLCVSKARPDLLAVLNAAQTELASDEPNYINLLRSKNYPVSISSRAFSLPEKKWLSQHKTLRIGYLNSYLPYSDTDASGTTDLPPGRRRTMMTDALE